MATRRVGTPGAQQLVHVETARHLARMGRQRTSLALDHVGDVDEHIERIQARHPHLGDRVGLEPFGQQLRVGMWIPGVRVHGRDGGLAGGEVKPLGDPAATTGKDFQVEWSTQNSTREWQLAELVSTELADMKDADGNDIVLSDPFPEAQEIQGRLVDDMLAA